MTHDVSGRVSRYDTFNGPVVEVLRELSVPAEISGRNDIFADFRKIFGNAQFATSDRMFSHKTLPLNSDLDDVTASLRPKPGKIESKGMKSLRSRVANISGFLSAVREREARRCGQAFERDIVAGSLSEVNPTAWFGDVSRDGVLNMLCP